MKRVLTYIVVILLLINGTGAVYGGCLLMADPSGKRLQLPVEWLTHTPFNNFFVPGLILFVMNGVFSFLVLILIMLKNKKAFTLTFLEGCILTGWIVVQIFLTQMYHPLQVVMAVTGVLLIATGLLLMKQQHVYLNKSA